MASTKRQLAYKLALSAAGIVALSLGLFHFLSGWHCDQTSRPSIESRGALGKLLFYDPSLSVAGTVSCATCHIPTQMFADNKRTPMGVYGRVGTRNAPSLAVISTAQDVSFFWDGRRSALDQAVIDPLTNPIEMGLPDQAELIRRIKQNPNYVSTFAKAFPESPQLTTKQVGQALADYVRSISPPPSYYEQYAMQGDEAALSPSAKLGLTIFKGKAQCAECHVLQGAPAMLTDHLYHRTGIGLDAVSEHLPELTQAIIQRSLKGAAIGDRVAAHLDEAQLGRFNVTLDPADIGLFRTPSLRSVALTAPYMHDGSILTLEEAIDREVYYRSLQAGHPLNLSVEERKNLKAFLEAL